MGEDDADDEDAEGGGAGIIRSCVRETGGESGVFTSGGCRIWGGLYLAEGAPLVAPEALAEDDDAKDGGAQRLGLVDELQQCGAQVRRR